MYTLVKAQESAALTAAKDAPPTDPVETVSLVESRRSSDKGDSP